jgi:hypothetical protein
MGMGGILQWDGVSPVVSPQAEIGAMVQPCGLMTGKMPVPLKKGW